MDTLLQDVKDRKSLDTVRQLRATILDCSKNIKSNDETFKISTLPDVADKFRDMMSSYVDIYHHVESNQKTFVKLGTEVMNDDHEIEEFTDLNAFEELYKRELTKEKSRKKTDEAESLNLLNTIIHPQDEVVVEEAPEQIPKDPITKRNIKIAVRSTRCGHIYDKISIEAYITQKEKSRSNKVQCPVAGCSNTTMKKTELIDDEKINNLINS